MVFVMTSNLLSLGHKYRIIRLFPPFLSPLISLFCGSNIFVKFIDKIQFKC